jgi:hypothetical protein
MADSVTVEELQTALENIAWAIAQKALADLPPYLADDELTAQRLFEQNKGQLSSVNDARTVLDKLVEAGELRIEERRTRKGGSPVKIYLPVK